MFSDTSRQQGLAGRPLGSAPSNVKESLEVGNLADFACLSGDSLSVPEDEIKDIVFKFTVLDCKIVYQGTDA